ncbi:MAG TPA: hypothetical protein VGN34_26535, partial [Ktedonobacteraceae bacterium]
MDRRYIQRSGGNKGSRDGSGSESRHNGSDSDSSLERALNEAKRNSYSNAIRDIYQFRGRSSSDRARPPSVHSSDFEYITPEERGDGDQRSPAPDTRITYNDKPGGGLGSTLTKDGDTISASILGKKGPSIGYEGRDGYGGQISASKEGDVHASLHNKYFRGGYESKDDKLYIEPRLKRQVGSTEITYNNKPHDGLGVT